MGNIRITLPPLKQVVNPFGNYALYTTSRRRAQFNATQNRIAFERDTTEGRAQEVSRIVRPVPSPSAPLGGSIALGLCGFDAG